jgi:hypothetical protein
MNVRPATACQWGTLGNPAMRKYLFPPVSIVLLALPLATTRRIPPP